MRLLTRLLKLSTLLAVVAAVLLALLLLSRARPQDMPWTPLDLGQPVGAFTGRKLTALTQDFPRCRALLDRAGIRYTALPPRFSGPSMEEQVCGYGDGVRLGAGGPRTILMAPADVVTSCSVAAALAVWEWEVVQPAALRHLGQRVSTIDHLGSYSCRRMYGRDAGAWSEHATARAIDIAGFRLADGTRITVLEDWRGGTGEQASKAAFLREVRDGACKLFATTLSPDYNAAHRDHLHLDQAARGRVSWRACR